jgi:hypothetical protein
MKPIAKVAIATSAVACAAIFSFDWSEQSGLSLSIESAQARVGRPLTPVSVAGVARRQNRRAAYGYGAGWRDSQPYWGARSYVGGYGVAGAAAIGTAAAVGATQPWGWGGGYYGGGPLAARAAYYGGGYGAGPNCTPGTYYIAADGLVQFCQ